MNSCPFHDSVSDTVGPQQHVHAIQGDKEKELGMPVSPLMDRTKAGGMTRSQVHFLAGSACMYSIH